MFREMRRSSYLLDRAEVENILNQATNGVLSVIGDGGYPYGVPVSYIYHDNKIIFHGAVTGHKVDSIGRDPKVSFTVVAADDIIPEKFTTAYKSVIAFGKARILTEGEEFMESILVMCKKYSPGLEKAAEKYARAELGKFTVGIVDIEHVTGKGGK